MCKANHVQDLRPRGNKWLSSWERHDTCLGICDTIDGLLCSPSSFPSLSHCILLLLGFPVVSSQKKKVLTLKFSFHLKSLNPESLVNGTWKSGSELMILADGKRVGSWDLEWVKKKSGSVLRSRKFERCWDWLSKEGIDLIIYDSKKLDRIIFAGKEDSKKWSLWL